MTDTPNQPWAPIVTREVTLDDQPVPIRRMRMRQILAVTPMLEARPDLLGGALDFERLEDLLQKLPRLIAKDGAAWIEVLAAASAQDEQRLLDADPAELLLLAAAVLEVNTDFFSQRMAPAIAALLRAVVRLPAAPTAGQTPSRRSSPAGTG